MDLKEENQEVPPKTAGASRLKTPRCTVCHRFIGYAEMDRGEILFDFTPDTHFTVEKLEHTHKACEGTASP